MFDLDNNYYTKDYYKNGIIYTIKILNDIYDDNMSIIKNLYDISDNKYKLVKVMLEEIKNNNTIVIENVLDLKNFIRYIDLNFKIIELLQKLKNCNNFIKVITCEYSFYDNYTEDKCKFCNELKEINEKNLGICKKDKIIKYFDHFTI